MARLVAPDPTVMGIWSPRRRKVLLGFLVFLFLLRLGTALGAMNRGFELGDEGYFLLNLNQPEAALPPHEIYRFLAALSGGAEIGVVGARLSRILAELTGSLALVAGVLFWARRRLFANGAEIGLAYYALAAQGTLLSIASRSFGYNDLTNLFSFSVVGGLFALAGTRRENPWQRAALATAIGLLTGLQLVTKFPPAGGLAVLVTVMILAVFPWPSRRERATSLALYAAGIAAMVALVVVTTGGTVAMMERLSVAAQLPALTGYDPVALLARYLYLDQLTILNSALFGAGFAVAYGLGGLRSRDGHDGAPAPAADRRLAVAVACGFLALLAGVFRYHPNFLHPSVVVLACFVAATSIALLAATRGRHRAREDRAGPRERGGLLLTLLALPFLEIAGTNVPVTMRLPTHILPWFALLAVLVLERRPEVRRPLYRVVAVVLVLVTTVVFVHHHWLRPYGLRTAIHAQTVPIDGLPGVRMDLASADFLELVASTLLDAGFQRGDAVLALDYMPGLVHYLGGTSPRYNLYMFDLPAFACFNLASAEFERPPFLIVAREPGDDMLRCLQRISFPEDYELLRTLRFPYEDAYVAFGAHDFSHVLVYGPRRPSPGSDP